MKKRIGIIFGGRSVEHEVSIITALQVMENIDKSKFDVIPIYINKDGRWFTGDCLKDYNNFKNKTLNGVKEIHFTPTYKNNNMYVHPDKKGIFGKRILTSIDVFFPLIHGTNGEDGTLQGFLELINVPYVGGSVQSYAVGMDKVLMKDVFKSHGLPIVDYMWFYRKKWHDNQEKIMNSIEEKLEYPVFVKPANLGSSVGISKAKNKDELYRAIEIAIRYDRKIIVEQGIDVPREINIAVLGYDDKLKTSLCEEPLGWTDFLSYEDKYINNSKSSGGKDSSERRQIPANIPEDMTLVIQDLAKKAFMAIDCSGNARLDFLIDEEKNIYINEINTVPGSIAFYLWEPTGISFKDLISELIDIAEKTYSEKKNNIYSYDIDLFKRKELTTKGAKI